MRYGIDRRLAEKHWAADSFRPDHVPHFINRGINSNAALDVRFFRHGGIDGTRGRDQLCVLRGLGGGGRRDRC